MPTIDALLDDVYGSEDTKSAPAPKAAAAPSEPAPQATDKPLPANNLGEMFSNYVGGPIQDKFNIFLQQAGMSRAPAEFVSQAAVPDTLTGAAITGATLLAPEAKAMQYFGTAARNSPKIAAAVDRMLAPIVGGAVGGYAEKGSPNDAMVGAGLGAITGIPAEVASGVSRWYAGSKLAQRFYQEDPARLGKVVRDLVPEFGKVDTPEQFGSKVWQGVAQDKLSEVYDRRMTAIASRVKASAPPDGMPASMFLNSPDPIIGPGAKITSPTIQRLQQDGVIDKTTNYKVDDLLSDIRDLRLKGRTVKGDPKLTLDGRQARDYAAELSSDYYEAVKNSGMPHAKQLANQYLATDKKYARGAEMLRYLKQPEIVDEDARLNMPLLQRQMKVERAYGLSHAFEPDEFKNLMDAVFRGADSSVVDKVIKGEPYLSMHATERGSLGLRGNLLNMLRNNKYAGNYDVDFLKPKPVAVGLQRLPAGAVKSFNRPISLAAPEDDSSE